MWRESSYAAYPEILSHTTKNYWRTDRDGVPIPQTLTPKAVSKAFLTEDIASGEWKMKKGLFVLSCAAGVLLATAAFAQDARSLAFLAQSVASGFRARAVP